MSTSFTNKIIMLITEFFQLLREAIQVEKSEGDSLKAKVTELQTKLAESQNAIETLTASLSDAQKQLADQVASNAEEMQSILTDLAAVNPTPVADAIVDAVVEDGDIDTPTTVEETEIVPELVTPVEVTDAAIGAIEESTTGNVQEF